MAFLVFGSIGVPYLDALLHVIKIVNACARRAGPAPTRKRGKRVSQKKAGLKGGVGGGGGGRGGGVGGGFEALSL